jgi:hypothetical protein
LKVAEALQVKGLHGEVMSQRVSISTSEILISFFSLVIFFLQSTTDNEEREREREREENNYASQYRQQQQQQALQLQQQQFNYSGHMRQPTPNQFQHPDNIINENRANIRHHIKPKTSLVNNPDTTSINLNNNNVNIANNNTKAQKFGVQQVNSSSKMLDNQKYQKYFSKRKLVAQYEQEMRQEKRNRLTGDSIEEDDDNNNNQPLNMRRSQSTTEDDTRPDNGKSVGLNLIQNIKTEKSEDDHTVDVNGNEDNGAENIGFYGTHMGKIKHSILEPNIVLQHSDEVLSPTNGNKSIANSLQNTNISQKTAS